MNKKNKILRSTIIILLIFLSLIKVSCSSIKPVEKNNFLTKKVIHDSRDHFVTFELEIPEGWIACEDAGYRSIRACPENMTESIYKSSDYHLILGISCYREKTGDLSYKERIAAIEELLNGNSKPYETFTKDNVGEMDDDIVTDDFEFELFKGTYGKIATVKYTVTYPEEHGSITQHVIRCYREDIPYMVTGAFGKDDSLSSGDIALWAANTLKVTEHFTAK